MMEDEKQQEELFRFTLEAKANDMPLEWNACAFCGAQQWVFPPHGVCNPCPLVQTSAEQAELMATTQRNQAILSGQALSQFMSRFVEGEEDEDE